MHPPALRLPTGLNYDKARVWMMKKTILIRNLGKEWIHIWALLQLLVTDTYFNGGCG